MSTVCRLVTFVVACLLCLQLTSSLPALQNVKVTSLRDVLLATYNVDGASSYSVVDNGIVEVQGSFRQRQVSREVFEGTAGEKDICDRYDVDGCSIPFGLPFFFKGLFTHSCNRHDICYHCGVAYNITKYVCDTTFRQNMREACEEKYNSTDSSSELSAPHLSQPALLRKKQVLEVFRGQESTLKLTLLNYFTRWTIPGSVGTLSEFWFYAESVKPDVITTWARVLAQNLPVRRPDVNIPIDGRVSHGREEMVLGENNNILKQNTQELNGGHGSFYFRPFERKSTGNLNSQPISVATSTMSQLREDQKFCQDILAKVSTFMSPTLSHYEPLTCAEIDLLVCDFFAEIYYYAVNLFGGNSYRDVPEFYCHQSFVPKCLPPLP